MKRVINRIKRRIKRVLKNEEGFTTFLWAVFVSFIIIYNIAIWSPVYSTQQHVITLTEEIVEEVEFTGKVDRNTYKMIDEMISKLNLTDNDITYKFTGAVRSDGKIQLRDQFEFEVKGKREVVLANFSFKTVKIDFPVKKSLTGRSQVYYKPSEL